MKQDFAGKVAVITGAAQSIGFACAESLAMAGARVIIADINEPRAEESAVLLRENGLQASSYTLDVRDPGQVNSLVEDVIKQFDRLDIWVNNAGVAHHHDSFTLPPDLWQSSIDVMLSGSFYGCQAAGRAMRDRDGGTIINMASVNGFVSNPRRAAYNSVKAALIMLTRTLASEWAPYHIRVNAVAPSPVATSGMAEWGISHGMANDNIYVERHPMKRMAKLREVTDAVLFLAGEEASFVTGETLCIDGGWVAYGYL